MVKVSRLGLDEGHMGNDLKGNKDHLPTYYPSHRTIDPFNCPQKRYALNIKNNPFKLVLEKLSRYQVD